ncbi:MAG: GspE/PulE family protein [Pirellulales bacterium]
MSDVSSRVAELLEAVDPADPDYAIRVVQGLLDMGREIGASDVHLQPTRDGLQLRWRLDGVLHPLGTIAPPMGPNIVSRLKVLARLLTYRTDIPQEGRIRDAEIRAEMRVSTFPTLHGERAVVRIFSDNANRFRRLDDLEMPGVVRESLGRLLCETSGAILIVGPAGSGKTTTAYACLRETIAHTEDGRSVVSLEDPIETDVEGVAQSQVHRAAGFDLATGLRSLMRQDPEVILIGEMRDRETAEIAFQAALTGQLVVTTFHAASAAGAVGRLLDMGIEPYVLRSGVLAIVAQRLIRRLCHCARPVKTMASAADHAGKLGLPVAGYATPVGCPDCRHTGYAGRFLLAEILEPDNSQLGRAMLERQDVASIEQSALAGGMIPIFRQACQVVEAGQTSPVEVRRVVGSGKVQSGETRVES